MVIDKFPLLEYCQITEKTVHLAGHPIIIFGKPGMGNWKSATPSDHLLSRFIQPKVHERIVVFGSGNGALVSLIGKLYPTCEFWVSDVNAISLDCLKQSIIYNGLENIAIHTKASLLPENSGTYDTAIMLPGKGRKLARRWLVEAFHLLKPNGNIFVSGSNEIGIQSIVADAENLFGVSAKILGYKKGHRAAFLKKLVQKPQPVWASESGISPGTWHSFKAQIMNKELIFHSLPGVFSYDQIDEGTEFLVKSLPEDLGNRVLDVGCGFGVIGLTLALESAWVSRRDGKIDMIDTNILAIESTKKNISANQGVIHSSVLKKVDSFPNDLMCGFGEKMYDVVVSNPPFHTGKIVDYTTTKALIQQANHVLSSTGKLIIVANRFIRYEKIMANYFKNVDIINQNNRFHIIAAQYPL